jgi:hypothetical protein
MSDRISIKDLQAVCDRINRATGSPMKPYERDAADRLIAQIGNYHLDQAYGGVSLVRMVNEGGGISNVLGWGHLTKRDLYERIHAFIRGLEASKESQP